MPTHDDERFDRIDGAIERLGASIERIDASIERLTKYILDFREEASTRLRGIESRLDLQAVALTSIDAG
jgi:archaellum component FlaC